MRPQTSVYSVAPRAYTSAGLPLVHGKRKLLSPPSLSYPGWFVSGFQMRVNQLADMIQRCVAAPTCGNAFVRRYKLSCPGEKGFVVMKRVACACAPG